MPADTSVGAAGIADASEARRPDFTPDRPSNFHVSGGERRGVSIDPNYPCWGGISIVSGTSAETLVGGTTYEYVRQMVLENRGNRARILVAMSEGIIEGYESYSGDISVNPTGSGSYTVGLQTNASLGRGEVKEFTFTFRITYGSATPTIYEPRTTYVITQNAPGELPC
jgi:hypothetical protein